MLSKSTSSFLRLAVIQCAFVAACMASHSAQAQQNVFQVVEVMEFQWTEGHPQWRKNSHQRLHNASFSFSNGQFGFDLPDMDRELFPIYGTYSGTGSEYYFQGTSEWSPGIGFGQITHIEGTLTVEGDSLVAKFFHQTRAYSTGYQSGYFATVRLR